MRHSPFVPIVLVLFICLGIGGNFHIAKAVDWSQLGVVEVELTSSRDDAAIGDGNPFVDEAVIVEAVAPSGRTQRVDAFWDGGRTWRARWRGDETGEWKWTATAQDAANAGLNASGAVAHGEARPPRSLKASDDGTHLVSDADEPFFWLGDTAWNGALRSQPADWETYLKTRAEQKFTVIQFVATQWRGGDKVIPRHVFQGTKNITVFPEAFSELDEKVAAVTRAGLRPAPVMLWTLTESDPGQALDEADAIRLARYEAARWGALTPAWLLGGDGPYLDGDRPDRWRRIGRAVFGDQPEQLVTLHPCGLSWVGDAFAGEEWFDFLGYQSGHGDANGDLEWLTLGPPAQHAELGKPIINLEPNYEGHPAYQSGKSFTAYEVRRAAYWSMLVTPPAGVTYGNNEIWVWNETTADAENHGNLPGIHPWREGLKLPGIADMTRLRDFFESGAWARLRPAQQLLAKGNEGRKPSEFIAVAQSPAPGWIVAYLPTGGRIELRADVKAKEGTWFNPRTGESQVATFAASDAGISAEAPTEEDWVLSIP